MGMDAITRRVVRSLDNYRDKWLFCSLSTYTYFFCLEAGLGQPKDMAGAFLMTGFLLLYTAPQDDET
jgi:hypothetical protein